MGHSFLHPRIKELVYPEQAFSRQDDGEDAAFYARERLVSHVDDLALKTIRQLRPAVDAEP